MDIQLYKNMESTRNYYKHNAAVLSYVIDALIRNRLVDPFKFMMDTNYATDMIATYIHAHNLAAETMHDESNKLVLYEVD